MERGSYLELPYVHPYKFEQVKIALKKWTSNFRWQRNAKLSELSTELEHIQSNIMQCPLAKVLHLKERNARNRSLNIDRMRNQLLRRNLEINISLSKIPMLLISIT